MNYSVMLLHTCVLAAMLANVNGHWKTKGTGKCRVQSQSTTDKTPAWEWVDCVYSAGGLIKISTTKRPTTTQKPLTINGQFKNRGPGKCLVQSETQKTKKGNQPAWVWMDCDYTGGRPKPITTKAPDMVTTAIPTTVRPAVPAPVNPRPPVPVRPPVPHAVQPSMPTRIPGRPPVQVPGQFRPPAAVPARPVMSVPVPSRPPVPALFPVRPPVVASVSTRPQLRVQMAAHPTMSAPITSRSATTAIFRQASQPSTTPRNEVCKGRWCWDGKIWVDKGSSSTEKMLNIFKKPTLP